jgi:hypothetical protein
MKITGKRIFSAIMLLSCAVTIYQLLSKPQPVAPPQRIDTVRANATSFDRKVEQLGAPKTADDPAAEVHFTSDELNAEVAQSTGSLPAAAIAPAVPTATSSTAPLSPNTVVAPGDVQVKDYQVKLDGDVARGQFVTQIAGKDVYVTLAGHLKSEDGYVTFDPTEFKIGDLSIPVSLVNPALQKKLMEQKGQLKLPENVGSLRVENGELVVTPK